jgi:hypothetical protein
VPEGPRLRDEAAVALDLERAAGRVPAEERGHELRRALRDAEALVARLEEDERPAPEHVVEASRELDADGERDLRPDVGERAMSRGRSRLFERSVIE